MELSQFKDKTFAIIGLGKTGFSAANFLRKHDIECYIWDDNLKTRQAAEQQGFSVLKSVEGPWPPIDIALLSPGLPLTHNPHKAFDYIQKNNIQFMGDIEFFYKLNPNAHYIGITGTNGKSTTTALIGYILKEADFPVEVGGNIGTPVLELTSNSKEPYYVFELSSFQLDLIDSFSPEIAVLLIITPDHLDRHGNIEAYIDAKKRLLKKTPHQKVVLGIDTNPTKQIYEDLKKHYPQQVYPVSLKNIHPRFIKHPYLKGVHNQQNMMAAFEVGKILGIPEEKLIASILNFKGLHHRQEFVTEHNHITFINDSKATNGSAASKALVCYDSIYWILGGVPKEDKLEDTLPHLKNIKRAYLIGQCAEEFWAVLNPLMPTEIVHTLDQAVKKAADDALQNKEAATILLSPACASYDQFSNFEERGNMFKRYVTKWIEEQKV
jgi:UDP-N-acetylmuramoylalanine--D-glutamate ligase